MNIVPTSVVEAFAQGEILQVLFFSILFGIALANLGERARGLVRVIDEFSRGLFKVVHYIMEGKESRFGILASSLYAVVTTAAS